MSDDVENYTVFNSRALIDVVGNVTDEALKATKIKQLIGLDHPDFLEFIVAALYKLAYVDGVYSEQEEKDIRKVAAAFGVKKTLFDQIFVKLNLTYTTLKGKKINA